MNSGYVGGKDVVAFYDVVFQDIAYGCLKPGELYVDDLSRNVSTGARDNMDNAILSHTWVTASACAPGSFIS
jgi:hypothetical protein